MNTTRLLALATLLLVACGDERGDVDCRCKADGTCNGPRLECVDEWFVGAVCRLKKEKR